MGVSQVWSKVCDWAEKKISCAAVGKGNMSRVSLGLWLWDEIICLIDVLIMPASMVVVMASSHRGSSGSIPQWGRILSCLWIALAINMQCEGSILSSGFHG